MIPMVFGISSDRSSHLDVFDTVITEDESWYFHYDPEMKY